VARLTVRRFAVYVFAALLPLALSGQARAGLLSCGSTSEPFAPWQDTTNYVLAPNGNAEAGTTNWTLTGGAKVVSGNETFYVHGTGESHSILIPAGGTATMNSACVSLLSFWTRFFARNTGAAAAPLKIRLVYKGLLGNVVGILDVNGDEYAGHAWAPVKRQLMSGGVLAPLTATSVQVRLSVPAGSGGAFQVDDLFVDPWALR